MNPIGDVHDPASPEQEVVYVVTGKPAARKILVTIRRKAWEEGTPAAVFKVAAPTQDE